MCPSITHSARNQARVKKRNKSSYNTCLDATRGAKRRCSGSPRTCPGEGWGSTGPFEPPGDTPALAHPSIHPSIHPTIRASIHPSIHPSIHRSTQRGKTHRQHSKTARRIRRRVRAGNTKTKTMTRNKPLLIRRHVTILRSRNRHSPDYHSRARTAHHLSSHRGLWF